MSSLLYGLFLVTLAFLVHLIWWKVSLPRRQTKTLLIIFFSILLGGLLLLCTPVRETLFSASLPLPTELYQIVQVCILFTAFTLAYMITYSAIEADSPSLVITTMIEESMPDGIKKEDFEAAMNNELLITPRVNDLLLDLMAEEKEGRYYLTQKGKNMARLFAGFRSLFGITHLGG